MRALTIDAHGWLEQLRVRDDVPRPALPASGGVRVRLRAAALNHLDLWVRRGVPGHRFPLPLVPGSDVVGVREDTGERVALHPGLGCQRCPRCLSGRHELCRSYRIRGETMDGGMAERVAVSEAELLPCPLDPAVAAGAPAENS